MVNENGIEASGGSNLVENGRFEQHRRALSEIVSRRAAGGALGALALTMHAAATSIDTAAADKKRKRRRKRRNKKSPPPAAFGCTVEDASCPIGATGVPCPEKLDGRCDVTVDNHPFCRREDGGILCVTCNRHDTCRNLLGKRSGARCVQCAPCNDSGSINRACLFPA